jgi:hypothetical protein
MRRTSKTPRFPLPKRPLKPSHSGISIHTEAQELWVAEQLCHGIPIYKIRQLATQKFQCSNVQAQARIEAVRERWVAEDKAQIEKWKSEAARRLYGGMQLARDSLKDKPHQLHQILLRYEDQLAKIQGTYAAVKIDIDVAVSQRLVGVVANLTAEQVAEHLNNYRETQRLASEYKRLSTHDHAAE